MPRKSMKFANTKSVDEYTYYEKFGIGKTYNCENCKNNYINPDVHHIQMVEVAKKRHVKLSDSKIVCEFCFKSTYT